MVIPGCASRAVMYNIILVEGWSVETAVMNGIYKNFDFEFSTGTALIMISFKKSVKLHPSVILLVHIADKRNPNITDVS
jgi:hypothetical protein